MTICLFGDSITYGLYDAEGGWATRLAREVNKFNPDTYKDTLIYNLGVLGDNTHTLLERFDTEISVRTRSDKEIAVLFSIGTNDSLFVYDKNESQVPLAIFKENLRKLIEQTRKFTDKIAFTGLLSVNDSILNPIPWHKEGAYKTEYVEKYDKVTEEVTKSEGVVFISLKSFSDGDWKSLLTDGVHPNDRGHAMIAKIIGEDLRNRSWI